MTTTIVGTPDVRMDLGSPSPRPLDFIWNSGQNTHIIKTDEDLRISADKVTLKAASTGDLAPFRSNLTDVMKVNYEALPNGVTLEQLVNPSPGTASFKVLNNHGPVQVQGQALNLQATNASIDALAPGKITIDSSGDELDLRSDQRARLMSTNGDANVRSVNGDAKIHGKGLTEVVSDFGNVDLLAGANVRVTFGSQASTGGFATFNLARTNSVPDTHAVLAVHESGDIDLYDSEENGPNNTLSITIKTGIDTTTSGSYDAAVQVGVDDFYRGVVEVHNEFGTNKRQGVLTLYDQDGTPWFLWVSTAGQLWINSSDPETYDEGTPGSELVGEQHS